MTPLEKFATELIGFGLLNVLVGSLLLFVVIFGKWLSK